MPRVRPSEDVRPLSEFRAKVATFVQQVQGTGRPLILTVHGRSAAVLVDVGEYESLLDELELLRDVRTAEAQLKKGRGVGHPAAKTRILGRLRK
jgi:antitoxin YefM